MIIETFLKANHPLTADVFHWCTVISQTNTRHLVCSLSWLPWKLLKSAVSQKILSAPNKKLEDESSLTDKNETPMAEIQTLTNMYFLHMTHSPSVLFADTPTHTYVPVYSEWVRGTQERFAQMSCIGRWEPSVIPTESK